MFDSVRTIMYGAAAAAIVVFWLRLEYVTNDRDKLQQANETLQQARAADAQKIVDLQLDIIDRAAREAATQERYQAARNEAARAAEKLDAAQQQRIIDNGGGDKLAYRQNKATIELFERLERKFGDEQQH